jgi:hypothetical protein
MSISLNCFSSLILVALPHTLYEAPSRHKRCQMVNMLKLEERLQSFHQGAPANPRCRVADYPEIRTPTQT